MSRVFKILEKTPQTKVERELIFKNKTKTCDEASRKSGGLEFL